MEIETEATEVGGRAAAKENVDPVANQGAISPNIETRVENELPVTVALMVRPLVGGELVDGCRECVTVHANEPSVSLVSEHKFTYDHVYHGSGPSEKALYAQCVEPLVRGLLGGYNATVLAYGQTGSGKTFTMGTARDASRDFASETSSREPLGVIPRVMRTLFERVAALPGDTSVSIKVGFIEIHKEEIRDLLRPKSAVSLRDAPDGVTLVGAREKEVRTIEEMATTLRDGSSARATAATGMNDRSSRSHAIFTIHVETASGAENGAGAPGDATRAKMHLVDLAGSERAKRTKAEGARLQEGIQINKGLLALGNVISALGDDKRRRAKGAHVPYRDSKLTRLLQDALGGNSRTVMVACVSPADANLDETLNTLKYANRARNIVNTPVVTFDENAPDAATRIAKLRRALAAARSEIAHLKLNGAGALGLGSGNDDVSARFETMEARAMLAEAEASRLRADLKAAEENAAASAAAELAAGVERDVLALKLQDAGISAEEDHGGSNVVRGYLSTIQSLRNEQIRLKNQLRAAREGRADPYAEDPAASYDLDDEPAFEPEEPEDLDAVDDEEELEEDAEGDDLQAELADVERTLQAKEARMRAMSSQAVEMQAEVDAAVARGGVGAAAAGAASAQQDIDVEAVREKYGRLLKSLETEKLEIAAERDRLLAALSAAAKNGADARKAAEVKTRGRLLELEQRLKEVSKLAAKHKDAARLREKSDMAAKALQADIQRLRAARVELVRRMERATKEGIAKQRESERALQQAKKEGRRHALAARKAQSAVDRQAAVLRRKTEEASNAREQLRALQAAAKANRRKHAPGARDVDAETAAAPVASRPEISVAAPAPVAAAVASVEAVYKNDAAGPGTGLGLNARKQWLEAELVASVERAELRAALEESLARRAALGRRLPRLASPGSSPEKDAPSPASRASAAAEMRAVTEQIASLQERLYRSEAREERRGGARRWSRVRSTGEARSLLTILFNSAAAARRAASGAFFGDGFAVRDAAKPATEDSRFPGTTKTADDEGVAREAARAPLARTPSVVREADAVLRALKKKSAPVREKRKKLARPAWQDVGPATLLPPASEEKRAESPETASTAAAAASGSGSSPATSASGASESAADESEVGSASASASMSTPATEKPDERLQSLEELISTCRDARRRAEGLLDGSAAKARSPLGDVSNGVATARNASETVEPKRALTFQVGDATT